MKTLSFGETLWDIFTDSRCLGGAPLNVAGHLSRLGFDAYIVSCLGTDELGREALTRIADSGIKTDFVSMLSGAATGFTHIVLSHGIPDYEFNYPCAWDLIGVSGENLNKIHETDWDVFCFGTLAQRSDASRSTLKAILPEVKAKIVFFDVNLRKSFYSREILEWSLGFSDIFKMNDEESPVIKQLLGYSTSLPDEDFYAQLCDSYSLRGILVTRGKAGVFAFFGGKKFTHTPAPVTVVDTVGAGDSFSAAFLAALLAGKSVSESLAVATDLADYVVSHSGALPEYDEVICARLRDITSKFCEKDNKLT